MIIRKVQPSIIDTNQALYIYFTMAKLDSHNNHAVSKVTEIFWSRHDGQFP